MAFSVTMYECSDDPKVVGKNLKNAVTVSSIRPTGEVDLMTPTFELDYKEALTTKNYLVAPAPFNRHYFISDMKIDIGKKIYITCAVDVLETYKEDLLNCVACVTRSESIGKPTYVVDNKLPIDPSRKELKSALFVGGFEPLYHEGAHNLIVTMN